MTCRHCGASMAGNDQFCALCGKGVEEEPEANIFRVDLAKPSTGAPTAGDTTSAPIAQLVRLWGDHKKSIVVAAAAAVLLFVVVGSVIGAAGRNNGVVAIADAPTSAPEVLPTPVETVEPSFTPVPIIPHYSPSAGNFTAADPSRFVVPGWSGVTFLSPSGNVGCAISSDPDGYWGCAINEHHWQFERDSVDDFCYNASGPCGEGIEAMGTEITRPRLSDETVFPGAIAVFNGGSDGQNQVVVLQYGESLTLGAVTCYAESIAISCQQAISGHGFTIARDRNDVY